MLLALRALDKLKIPNRELHPPFCWQRSIRETLWYNAQFAIHMLRRTSNKFWLRLLVMGSNISQATWEIDVARSKSDERVKLQSGIFWYKRFKEEWIKYKFYLLVVCKCSCVCEKFKNSKMRAYMQNIENMIFSNSVYKNIHLRKYP